MGYCVLLRFDSAGSCPVLLREGEQLSRADGVRYRFVAETDSWDEANAIQEQLRRKIDAQEP